MFRAYLLRVRPSPVCRLVLSRRARGLYSLGGGCDIRGGGECVAFARALSSRNSPHEDSESLGGTLYGGSDVIVVVVVGGGGGRD